MECCLFLRGDLFVADSPLECSKGVNGLLGCGEKPLTYRKLGNSSTCEVLINSEIYGKENVFNRVDPSSRMNIMGMNLNITLECVTKENLLLSLLGTENKRSSDTKKDLICFCRCFVDGDVIILSEVPLVDDLTVSLKDAFGNVLQVLIPEIDFTIEDNKLLLKNTDLYDEKGITIQAEYKYEIQTSYEIEALSNQSKYKDIVFVGKNASDDELVTVRFFRVLFQPINQFDLISKGTFLNLPLNGVVEESNNGWFKFEKDGLDGSTSGPIY